MSHSSTPTKDQAGQYNAPAGHKAPEKVKLELLVALLAADVCHGDAHYRAQIQEMALRLLKELGEEGAEAAGRLAGAAQSTLAA
jgi:uncharacterized iron-regulated protein